MVLPSPVRLLALVSLLVACRPPPSLRDPAAMLLAELDSDGSGAVEPRELTCEKPEKRVAELDSDQSGGLELEELRAHMDSWFLSRRHPAEQSRHPLPQRGDPAAAVHSGKSILLISMDTVRWDRTSLADPGRDLTPSLADFAALNGSTSFEHAYAAAPFSLGSYASLFTGQPMSEHLAGWDRTLLAQEATTLAEVLEAYGYNTAAFTGGGEVYHATGLDQGFDVYVDGVALGTLGENVDVAVNWVRAARTRGQPWFAFVQGYDAHLPYRAPAVLEDRYEPGYSGLAHSDDLLRKVGQMTADTEPDGAVGLGIDPRDIRHLATHYDASVRAADYQLGRLLRAFDAMGVLDEALVVVMSDHGECLGTHESFHHGPSLEEWVLHVPLVVHQPDSRASARKSDAVVSLVDLNATLLAAAEVVPPAGARGVDLFADGHAVVQAQSSCCLAVRDRDWLLSTDVRRGEPLRWVLQRDGVGDDVAADHPDVLARLMAEVGTWEPRREGPARAEVPDDAELRRQLREGGYWAGPGR